MLYFIISLVTYFSFLTLKTRKVLIELEKTKYNKTKIKKVIFTKKNFLTLELLSLIIIIISFLLPSKIIGICTIVLYTILSLLEIKNTKDKFKFKKQNLKIIIPTIIIYLLIFTLIGLDYYIYQKGFILYDRINYYYPIVIVLGYILYPIIYLITILTKKTKKNKKQK